MHPVHQLDAVLLHLFGGVQVALAGDFHRAVPQSALNALVLACFALAVTAAELVVRAGLAAAAGIAAAAHTVEATAVRRIAAAGVLVAVEGVGRVIMQDDAGDPLGLDEALLSMKSYMIHHHMYAISVVFSEINKMQDLVPNPAVALKCLKENDLLGQVISITGHCLNTAFENSLDDATSNYKVFSPQNWTKAKGSLNAIRVAVKQYLNFAKTMPGGKELIDKLTQGLQMSNDEFEPRWTAD